MNNKDYYLACFRSLNTNKIKGNVAPHKPILLLSVISLFEEGTLTGNQIELNEELHNMFNRLWRQYVGKSDWFSPKIATPFWHLQNEPFWQLVSKTDVPVEDFHSPYSANKLRENFYAEIDAELTALLSDPNFRNAAWQLIVKTYF